MKIDLKEIRNIKTFFRSSPTKKSRTLIYPLRDWAAGLLTAVFVFVSGVIIIGIDFYFQLISPELPEVEEQPLVYKQNEVIQYAEQYNEKAKIFNEHRSSRVYVPVIDEPTTTTENVLEEETLAEDDVDG